jgi:hypothetical protein
MFQTAPKYQELYFFFFLLAERNYISSKTKTKTKRPCVEGTGEKEIKNQGSLCCYNATQIAS